MNPSSGRFWTMDEFEGQISDPRSLHKYLYAWSNPVTNRDPSGRATVAEITVTISQFEREVMPAIRAELARDSIPVAVAAAGGASVASIVFAVFLGIGLGGAALEGVKLYLKSGSNPDDDIVLFAHGTSQDFADDINIRGVNEEAIRRNSVGSRTPGSFFTLPLLEDVEGTLDAAQVFAQRQPKPWAILIGGLPKRSFEELKNAGLVTTDTIGPPGSHPEWVFHPGSFGVLNSYNQTRWRMIAIR